MQVNDRFQEKEGLTPPNLWMNYTFPFGDKVCQTCFFWLEKEDPNNMKEEILFKNKKRFYTKHIAKVFCQGIKSKQSSTLVDLAQRLQQNNIELGPKGYINFFF